MAVLCNQPIGHRLGTLATKASNNEIRRGSTDFSDLDTVQLSLITLVCLTPIPYSPRRKAIRDQGYTRLGKATRFPVSGDNLEEGRGSLSCKVSALRLSWCR